MEQNAGRTVVLYDMDCSFCVWCVAKVIALDRSRRLRYRPIEDPASAGPLDGMSHEQRLRSWHVVTPDGKVHSAGRAFAPLARALPHGKPVATVLERIPPSALDRAYYAIVKRRDRAGRLLTQRVRRRARATVLGRTT